MEKQTLSLWSQAFFLDRLDKMKTSILKMRKFFEEEPLEQIQSRDTIKEFFDGSFTPHQLINQ